MVDTEAFARGYTSQNNTQFGAGSFLLQSLALTRGERVLDVGCGPGNITSHIASLVGETGAVVGVDPSKERIAIALESATSGLAFYVGVAEDLSRFPDASFDVVFVNSTLHWVRDQPKAVKEFGRVLKSGGRLGISGGSGDFTAWHETIKEDVLSREAFRGYPDEAGPKFLKRKELEGYLDDAGFSKRSIVVNKIVKSTKNADEMIDWLDTSSSGKTYGGIPLDLRPRARQEMIAEWNKFATDDGIHMDMELLVTVAVRD